MNLPNLPNFRSLKGSVMPVDSTLAPLGKAVFCSLSSSSLVPAFPDVYQALALNLFLSGSVLTFI